MSVAFTDTDLGRARMIVWRDLVNGADGNGQTSGAYGDRSVQVTGVFGSGGTLVIEGSNDGENWKTLTDPQGNLLSFTATGIETIMESTRFTRPRVTAGDGTTALIVHIYARKSIQ